MIFDSYKILLVVFIAQTLFLIGALQLIPKKNKQANRMLQAVLILFFIILVDKTYYMPFLAKHQVIMKYGYLMNIAFFLLGPCLYFYVKRLLLLSSAGKGKWLVHFILPLTYVTYSVIHVLMYDTLAAKKYYFSLYSFLFEAFSILSITMYLVLSYRMIKQYQKQERYQLSFDQSITRFLLVNISVMFFNMVAWAISVVCGYGFRIITYPLSEMIWLSIGIQIYIIAVYSLRQPEIFKARLKERWEKGHSRKNRLKDAEIDTLKEKTDAFLIEEKGFLEPELSLNMLAQELKTSTNDLSWLLNNVYQKSFYELINGLRVDEFIARIKENRHKEFTLIAIGAEVGFKSKSTFYKAFKKLTGQTPSMYVKNIDNRK